MKKIVLTMAAVATLAMAVSAPAEARGLRGFHHRGGIARLGAAAAIAGVAATAIAASSDYGYGYGYGPYYAPVVVAPPVVVPYSYGW